MHWADIQFNNSREFTTRIPALDLVYTVPKNTIFSWHLAKYGSFEAENTNILLDIFGENSGGMYVDVGANFGWYTCLLSKFAGSAGQVFSVEPDSSNLELLRQNVAQNSLTNVTILPCAVSKEDGFLQLHKAPPTNPGMHSFVAQSHTPERSGDQRIEMKTLDGLLSQTSGAINLLKMDIEGFEVNALLGARATLQRCKHLLIEYSPRFLKAGNQDVADFFSSIRDAGLKIHTPQQGKLLPVEESEISALLTCGESDYYWQRDFICSREPIE